MTSLIAYYLNATLVIEDSNLTFNGTLSNGNSGLTLFYQFGGILNLSSASMNISDCYFFSTLTFTNAFQFTGFLGYSRGSNIQFLNNNGSVNWNYDLGYENGFMAYTY